MTKFFTAFLSLFLTATIAHATDGSSGCGPGWYIAKDNSIVSSAARAITNGILFPVSTIGMTFGTSNCTQHKLVLKEKESLHFVTNNYYELKSEVARGEGPYLQAYANTLGCSAGAQTRFNAQLKGRYNETFANSKASPDDALMQTYITILSDKDLAHECDAT
jgi:hypothetical protein